MVGMGTDRAGMSAGIVQMVTETKTYVTEGGHPIEVGRPTVTTGERLSGTAFSGGGACKECVYVKIFVVFCTCK